MADKIYLKGLRSFPKRQGAPDFVIGDLVITLDDLKAFLNDPANAKYITEYQGKKQIKINMTWGQEANVVFSVNTYGVDGGGQPKSYPQPPQQSTQQSAQAQGAATADDLPF